MQLHPENVHSGRDAVTCEHCGACVLVRKNSRQHTSVQWTLAAVRQCAEELDVKGCGRLRESIEKAEQWLTY